MGFFMCHVERIVSGEDTSWKNQVNNLVRLFFKIQQKYTKSLDQNPQTMFLIIVSYSLKAKVE
jgi:hypothetical protein